MTYLTVRHDPEAPNEWVVLLDDWDALRYLKTPQDAVYWAVDYIQNNKVTGGLQTVDKEAHD